MNRVEAIQRYLWGMKAKHEANFLLLMENPRPIPEHTDFIEAVISELEGVAKYDELLQNFGRLIEEDEDGD